MAAGQSSRFWPLNQNHKSLLRILGKPIICHTLDALRRIGAEETIIVQGPRKDAEKAIKEYFTDSKKAQPRIKYIVQPKAKGMGNALWTTRHFLSKKFLVLNAERVDIAQIVNKDEKTRKLIDGQGSVLFGHKTQSPQLFGIIKLKGNRVLEIIEKPKAGKEPSDIRILGFYVLEPKFFEFYKKIKRGTYDFEAALSAYAKNNCVKAALLKKPEEETPFLKYPWHLFQMNKYLLDTRLKLKIEKCAQIAKSAKITGKVYIGKNSKIFENAVIKGPCYIGKNCAIGNNTLIREYSNIEDDCLVGANAEITRCIFQENTHTHSGFFGDSIVGKNCGIGAGAITANRRLDKKEIPVKIKTNGKLIPLNTCLESLGAIIGENSHIGINTSLMPGVFIGTGCVIGPHSIVSKRVEDNTSFFIQFQKTSRSNKAFHNL